MCCYSCLIFEVVVWYLWILSNISNLCIVFFGRCVVCRGFVWYLGALCIILVCPRPNLSPPGPRIAKWAPKTQKVERQSKQIIHMTKIYTTSRPTAIERPVSMLLISLLLLLWIFCFIIQLITNIIINASRPLYGRGSAVCIYSDYVCMVCDCCSPLDICRSHFAFLGPTLRSLWIPLESPETTLGSLGLPRISPIGLTRAI